MQRDEDSKRLRGFSPYYKTRFDNENGNSLSTHIYCKILALQMGRRGILKKTGSEVRGINF